jgi:hypothetical protein
MPAKKSSGSRKKATGRKYGKAAGKAVASAMRRKKKGTLRSGKAGKGGAVKSRSTQEGRQGPEEKRQLRMAGSRKDRRPASSA